MNEQRVLAVPTTEDPTLSARGRLSAEYLDKALKVVEKTLDIELDPALRWKCAQWVLEMQMGKPRQEIDTTNSSEKALAAALSAALNVFTATKALPPVVEDGVYTLGSVVEGDFKDITDQPTPLSPDPAPVTSDLPTRSGRQWDALPS